MFYVYTACPSSCNQGLEQCDGLGTDCCNFYFEDKCEEECPEDGHVVDEDFNCVERTYYNYGSFKCSGLGPHFVFFKSM